MAQRHARCWNGARRQRAARRARRRAQWRAVSPQRTSRTTRPPSAPCAAFAPRRRPRAGRARSCARGAAWRGVSRCSGCAGMIDPNHLQNVVAPPPRRTRPPAPHPRTPRPAPPPSARRRGRWPPPPRRLAAGTPCYASQQPSRGASPAARPWPRRAPACRRARSARAADPERHDTRAGARVRSESDCIYLRDWLTESSSDAASRTEPLAA